MGHFSQMVSSPTCHNPFVLYDTTDPLSNFPRKKQYINMFSGCTKIPWSHAPKVQNFVEQSTRTQFI